MPWKECSVLDQRTEFALKSLGGGIVFGELCREFGISRKTGYKWRERFVAKGLGGLYEESRRPDRSPGSLSERVVCQIVRLKNAHPHWGPHKLRTVYLRRHSQGPSESSFKRVLDRAGLVKHRRKRRASPGQRLTTEVVANAPNDVWTVDFKGWWKMLGGGRCEPLTIRDLHSRYVLAVEAMESTCGVDVQAAFERVFQANGLPKVILSDNGPPFALSHSLLGLTRLSAWWIALGIRLHRIRPASPQENGSHERMHRDISTELQGQIDGGKAQHQAAFDTWRDEYNWERPHEALEMKVPGDIYRKSKHKWPGKTPEITYGPGYLSRRVTTNGTIKLHGHTIALSRALAGHNVGLTYQQHNGFDVWFDYLRLGTIDLNTEAFVPTDKGTSTA